MNTVEDGNGIGIEPHPRPSPLERGVRRLNKIEKRLSNLKLNSTGHEEKPD